MKPSTIEKALHQWKPWEDSIARARRYFHFTPLPSGDEFRKWKWDNHDNVYTFSQKELKRIGLPKSAIYYWLACFYSEFQMNDGTIDYAAIRDVTFCPSGQYGEKEYPRLFEYSVTVSASTPQELLATKIYPSKDTISILPVELLTLIKSQRGRPSKWAYLQAEIKKPGVKFQGIINMIAEDGDIQEKWQRIVRDKSNIVAFNKNRQNLLKHVYTISSAYWEKAGLEKPDMKSGEWSRNLFKLNDK